MSAYYTGQDQYGGQADHGNSAIVAAGDVTPLLSQLYRNHFGKMVAVLMYHTGIEDIAAAEDIVQEAFAIASEKWRINIPENPDAWLYKTVRNIAYNSLRKEPAGTLQTDYSFQTPENTGDLDLLRVLFGCLLPADSPKVQLVVVLRYVCGLRARRIAALLASNEESIAKMLYRWRAQQKPEHFKLTEMPGKPDEQKVRMALKTLYVMFTAGYQLSENGELTDESLCEDAVSLLQEMMKMGIIANGDVRALYALLLYNLARAESRIDQLAELTTLAEQDRSTWNREMIAVANHYLFQAKKESPAASAYQLEAAIAYKHTAAKTFGETDWPGIVSLYGKLVLVNASPFTKLGHAAALYFSGDVANAITILTRLNANPFFRNYHLIHCFWANIYQGKSDPSNALISYKKALSCPVNAFERRFIEKGMRALSE